MLSYNEIIKINKAFADAHYVIKNFGNGERWQIVDHDQQASFKYPLMFMEDLTNSSSNKEYIYGFKVWFVTRVESPSDRGTDLLFSEFAKAKSDMIQCAQDLIAYWVQDTNYPSLEIDRSFSIETFIEDTKDKLTGCSMDIRFKEVINYDNCLIPMDGVPAPASSDVTVTINDASFATLLAGTTNNITVIDTNGTEVGSKTGNLEWTVPAAGGGNAGNSLNGTSLTDIAAGTTKTFTITYADLSPVVVTTTSDSATAFVGTVPNQNAAAINTSSLYKTGQIASYVSGDDGDQERGRGFDFFNLSINNPFGHSKRMTGITGGYYDESTDTYRDVNGNSTTESLAFPSNLILNWGAYNQVTGDVLCMDYTPIQTGTNQSMIQAAPYTRGGFSGFYVANILELVNFFFYNGTSYGFGSQAYLEWKPFNHVLGATLNRVSSSTFIGSTSTVGIISNQVQNAIGITNSNTCFLAKYLNTSTDLGL